MHDRRDCARGAHTVPQRARLRCLAAAALLAAIGSSTAAAAICHVDAAATGADTGLSWTDAYVDLQSALTDGNCTEVWVAAGVYEPAAAGNVTVAFNIGSGVAVYGGFAGGEGSRDARDPAAHVTILSGDIDGNDDANNADGNFIDETSAEIAGSNSRHVVVLNGTAGTAVTATTVLDGFTLTGGSATDSGGALWCRGNGAGHECSPTLARLAFIGNKAASNGGAVALDGYSGGASNPTLSEVTFTGNSAGLFGGAMYNNAQLAGGASSPTLIDVTFSGNSSGSLGGAMFNDGTSTGNSSPRLTNVTFNANSASGNGGAVFNNGGAGTSSPVFTNVTFSGNSATGNGGAMYNRGDNGGASSPKVINATFNGNSAASGGAICGTNAFGPLLIGSIVWGDSATVDPEFCAASGSMTLVHSIIQNGCAANNCSGDVDNLTGDPKLGALADNGGFTRTLMPGADGAAIDALSCDYLNETPATDQRGAVRPDSASTGSTRCDIGAVEVGSLPGDRIFADRFGSHPWDDF